MLACPERAATLHTVERPGFSEHQSEVTFGEEPDPLTFSLPIEGFAGLASLQRCRIGVLTEVGGGEAVTYHH